MRVSWFHRLIDLVAPRHCPVCGCRLEATEEIICGACDLDLPRTGYVSVPYDNPMARLFWGVIAMERCAAFFFYNAHSEVSDLIYRMKYHQRPDIAVALGQATATEFARKGFFQDVDALVPVPLTKGRQSERGYNQSERIAHGVASVTGLPVVLHAVKRTEFSESQTKKTMADRRENVAHAFTLDDGEAVRSKHIVLIDDVVTTGSTIMACAKVLLSVPGTKVSVMSLGFASNPFTRVNHESPEEYRHRMDIPYQS